MSLEASQLVLVMVADVVPLVLRPVLGETWIDGVPALVKTAWPMVGAAAPAGRAPPAREASPVPSVSATAPTSATPTLGPADQVPERRRPRGPPARPEHPLLLVLIAVPLHPRGPRQEPSPDRPSP